MNDASYWKSQVDKLNANMPKSHENYYNQGFVDKMKQAQTNIDGLVAEKNKSWAATQQAQDDYNTFKGSMTSYRDAYKNAQAEFGVENAMANYEKSKKALAMAEMTLNALPSQINASSNRVLTQSQREQQYNVLSNQFNKVQTYQQKQNKTYEEAWKNAREGASAYAQSVVSGEQSKLNDFNNAWLGALDEYNASEHKILNAQLNKEMWTAKYHKWQAQQSNQAMAVWITNMSNALKRLDAAVSKGMEGIDGFADKFDEDLAEGTINAYYARKGFGRTRL